MNSCINRFLIRLVLRTIYYMHKYLLYFGFYFREKSKKRKTATAQHNRRKQRDKVMLSSTYRSLHITNTCNVWWQQQRDRMRELIHPEPIRPSSSPCPSPHFPRCLRLVVVAADGEWMHPSHAHRSICYCHWLEDSRAGRRSTVGSDPRPASPSCPSADCHDGHAKFPSAVTTAKLIQPLHVFG